MRYLIRVLRKLHMMIAIVICNSILVTGDDLLQKYVQVRFLVGCNNPKSGDFLEILIKYLIYKRRNNQGLVFVA